MSMFPDNLSQRERSMAYQDRLDAEAEWQYQQAVNNACEAIRRTPIEYVTSEYITQVLSTLACHVTEASKSKPKFYEVAECIEGVADEIEGMKP